MMVEKLPVYVAAAYPGRADSPERARVRLAYDLVRKSDHLELTHDWLANIDRARDAGLTEQHGEEAFRTQAALEDLLGVARARIFWFISPSIGGRGCFFESGGAWVFAMLQRYFEAGRDAMFLEPADVGSEQITRILYAGLNTPKLNVVSGPDYKNTIFTELFDRKFLDDTQALESITQYAIEALHR